MTTPSVTTFFPTIGLCAPVPWISAMLASTVSPGSPGSSGSVLPPDGVGVGSPATKSVEFSPVAATRATEVAFVVRGAGAVPEKVAAPPQPTRSTTAGSSAQVAPPQTRRSSESERAKTPWLPETAVVPVRSGSGSASVPPAPCASWMRKVPPAGTVPSRARTPGALKVPVAEAYWRDQPARSIGSSEVFTSSTKSWVKVEPELPPPP